MVESLIATDRTRDRLLYTLKTRGPMVTARLARTLGISVPGVRSHLDVLLEQGLVSATTERQGVGRPGLLWRVTDDAQRLFPDTHGALTVEVIAAIRAVLGEAALARVIAHRDEALKSRYRGALGNARRLHTRLERLAKVRTEDGYMAHLERDGDDWLFVENHCPICAAAQTCQGLCASELALFRDLLGSDVEVERTEYLLAGARRCAYRIKRGSQST